jgi:hypothetical protein
VTHSELCRLAANWVRKRMRAAVVLEDVKTIATNEQPDVIAWSNGGYSFLVECKVSYRDFARDAAKPFRKRPERGMGRERWYAFPEGFCVVDAIAYAEAQPGWGIVELGGKKPKIFKQPVGRPVDSYAWAEEKRLLISCVRRVTEGWGRGMFGEPAKDVVQGPDLHPRNRIRELEAELRQLRNHEERLRRGLQVDRDQLQNEVTTLREELARRDAPQS